MIALSQLAYALFPSSTLDTGVNNEVEVLAVLTWVCKY
jgi:hypothetical protein